MGLWAKGEPQSSDLTPDQASPAQGFTQQQSHAPQASGHGNHHVPQPSAAAFITLPVHPASPRRDHKQLCTEVALQLAMVVPPKEQQLPAARVLHVLLHWGACRYLGKFSALELWLQFTG